MEADPDSVKAPWFSHFLTKGRASSHRVCHRTPHIAPNFDSTSPSSTPKNATSIREKALTPAKDREEGEAVVPNNQEAELSVQGLRSLGRGSSGQEFCERRHLNGADIYTGRWQNEI
jgi:hypothetical protein